MNIPKSDKEWEELEKELAELYPDIDWDRDPAEVLLNDPEFVAEMERAIDELIEDTESP